MHLITTTELVCRQFSLWYGNYRNSSSRLLIDGTIPRGVYSQAWCSFWLMGEYYAPMLRGFYNDIGQCGMYILRLCIFFWWLMCEHLGPTSKFCNCQTHECCQCIIANVLKCSLSYIFILTPVFCCCKPCILRSSRSFILKMHQNRQFWKSLLSGKALKLLPPNVIF